MKAELRAGDIVMIRPENEKATLFQRAILLTGAKHTHDEILATFLGNLYCGCASLPHYQAIPFLTRVEQARKGEIAFAVFRWHEAMGAEPKMGGRWRQRFEDVVSAYVATGARQAWKYDLRAILTHARNYLRRRWLGKWCPLLDRQVEAKVYCTESVFNAYAVAQAVTGLPFNLQLKVQGEDGKLQPFVSPIHVEKLWKDGWLTCVADFGLMRYLQESPSPEATEGKGESLAEHAESAEQAGEEKPQKSSKAAETICLNREAFRGDMESEMSD